MGKYASKEAAQGSMVWPGSAGIVTYAGGATWGPPLESIAVINYPDPGIPYSTGSGWGSSITDNSADWNEAHGWGNHALAGYAVKASNETISGAWIFNGAVAYGGGNYAAKITSGDLWNANGIWHTFGDDVDAYISWEGDQALTLDVETLDKFIMLRGKDSGGTLRNCILAYPSNAVELYYNGSKKIETTSTGANITGLTDTDTLNVASTSIFGDDLGTSSFSSGFSGSGWKLDKDTDYSLTVDNLTVRKLMRIYELEINKISAINGALVVSTANGKAYSIDTGSGNLFASWNNAHTGLPGWTHFTSSGLDITAADNIPGGVGRAASSIPYVAKAGVTITIQGTLTLVTGTNTPAIVIYDHLTGTEITTIALDSGVNNKTYTFLADYDEVYFVFSSRYASDMAVSFTNVSITDSQYKIIFDEDNGNKQIQFAIDDYVTAQEWTGRGTDYYLGQVTNVVHNNTLGFAYIAVNNISGTPWTGCDLVQKGNSSDTDRQSAIYITSSDDDNPYMDVLAGIDDGDYTGKTKVRLGNLTGITDADFGALSGFGLWSDRVYLNNAYLKGSIYASAGTIGGFTITSSALSCGSAGSAGWGGINSNGTVGLTYLSTYIRSQQSEGGTYTLTLTAPVPRVLALDYTVESTLNLPSSGLPSSGSSTMITIIHAYGTGLGAGKYHIQGNGYYINSGGSRTTSIDLDEGEAITLVWDPRQGGQWYEC